MPTTQTDVAYEEIKKRILNGEYRPAQSLTEALLVADLNVSRNTIKKALLKLASERLVLIEPNKSAVVRFFSLEDVVQQIEVREALEGLIMEQAIPCITTEHTAEMGSIIALMQSYIQANDLINYSACNERLHKVIYDTCPNKYATELVLDIKARLALYNLRVIFLPGRSQTTFEEHKNIYQAICARDSEKAVAAIRKHIANIKKTICDNFSFLK